MIVQFVIEMVLLILEQVVHLLFVAKESFKNRNKQASSRKLAKKFDISKRSVRRILKSDLTLRL